MTDEIDEAIDLATDVGTRSELAKLILKEYQGNGKGGMRAALNRVLARADGRWYSPEDVAWLFEARVADRVALAEARERLAECHCHD